MTEQSKVQMNFHAPVHGVAGNVEGDMIIHAQREQNLAVAEICHLLNDLQQKHPNATASQAKDIVEAEIVSIQTHQPHRWQMLGQQLLSRERWLHGGKAALIEASQTLADKLWLNVLIAFLDGFSTDH